MTILDDILRRTREDVTTRRARTPLTELRARCRDRAPTRDFLGALRRESAIPGRRRGTIRVIAEIKRASPSRGLIRRDFDPAALALAYATAGAHALSVLTDVPYFQGDLAHLAAARRAVAVPILRKDFHIDSYQLWEAREAGADAALLIVGALSSLQLQDLLGLGRELGLAALVEVHTQAELDVALACGASLVGINNRDLRSFEVSLETTFRLLPAVPAGTVLVSESGISQPAQVERLATAGVDGILVGEGLLRHADAGDALRRLVGAA